MFVLTGRNAVAILDRSHRTNSPVLFFNGGRCRCQSGLGTRDLAPKVGPWRSSGPEAGVVPRRVMGVPLRPGADPPRRGRQPKWPEWQIPAASVGPGAPSEQSRLSAHLRAVQNSVRPKASSPWVPGQRALRLQGCSRPESLPTRSSLKYIAAKKGRTPW